MPSDVIGCEDKQRLDSAFKVSEVGMKLWETDCTGPDPEGS